MQEMLELVADYIDGPGLNQLVKEIDDNAKRLNDAVKQGRIDLAADTGRFWSVARAEKVFGLDDAKELAKAKAEGRLAVAQETAYYTKASSIVQWLRRTSVSLREVSASNQMPAAAPQAPQQLRRQPGADSRPTE
jgi:hypothetical protein